jgi:dephospho-CoA kinase
VNPQNNQAHSGNKTRPLVIGLTGGIGSGKSTVAGYFADLGITIVDADQLAHALAAPGEPAFNSIVSSFGNACLSPDGTLDRAWLRRRIHTNPEDKQKLEDILHPAIRTRMTELLDKSESPYSIAVIPLLLETGQTRLVDRILVVDVSEAQQRARVAARDGLSEDVIANIMLSQTDRNTRLSSADDVISNELDLESLQAQVETLHRQYLELAGH